MDLIYFSPVPWNSIAQRPHFFIKEAIRKGFNNIIWVNPTPSRLPEWSDLKRIVAPFEANSFDIPSQVTVIAPRMFPIEPFQHIYSLFNKVRLDAVLSEIKDNISGQSLHIVVGKPSIVAQKVIDSIDYTTLTVDVMDDYPCFFSGIARRSMLSNLKKLIERADICTYSCELLRDKYPSATSNEYLILNACDEVFLKRAKQKTKAKNEKMIFGYIGTVATWFDWESILSLSKEYPFSEIHIIGPNYAGLPMTLPDNVKVFPAIEHSLVVEVISSFDYGLIPFKLNELTDSVDPVKYYEYLACDVPVISTSFGQMKYRIANNNVFSFSNFDLALVINPELPVTWRDRFDTFFNIILKY